MPPIAELLTTFERTWLMVIETLGSVVTVGAVILWVIVSAAVVWLCWRDLPGRVDT